MIATVGCRRRSLGECHRRRRHLVPGGGRDESGVAVKVFVAGASGALGDQLVPELVAGGHQVVAMTRTASKQDGLRAWRGGRLSPTLFDPDAVARAAGEAPTFMMTDVRGASNAKAKRELGLQLRYPSWRLGFTKGLG
jgi:hypothetical protein